MPNAPIPIVITVYIILCTIIAILYDSARPKKSCWFCSSVRLISAHPHLDASMDALRCAPKFVQWVDKLDKTQLKIHSITITDINWFSATPDPKKLGFVKCTVDATDLDTGKKVASNIAFVRGDSVAILIIVYIQTQLLLKRTNTTVQRDRQYVLLCEQMRLASGGRQKEICAGMMDAEGNVASAALKEIKEETGFDIKHQDQLTSLGSILPSPGACDEEIFLYYWETTITQKEFDEKQGRIFGNAEEGEEIKLSFIPIDEFEKSLPLFKDVKAECAYYRFGKQ